MTIESVQCRHCRYYQITWDQNNPYGCKKLGFKTKLHPADYILNLSGEPCHSFDAKLTEMGHNDDKNFTKKL